MSVGKFDLERARVRSLAGQLDAVEQRALARRALNDPDLLDDLAFESLIDEALKSPAVQEALEQATAEPGAADRPAGDEPISIESARKPALFRRQAVLVYGGVAAVLALAVGTALMRQSPPARQASRQDAEAEPLRSSGSVAPLTPTLERAAAGRQPVLLASAEGRPSAVTFRGAPGGSRPPRSSGSVVGQAGDLVRLDLGLIDGVSTGAELDVLDQKGLRVGRLRVVRAFRERARTERLTENAIPAEATVRTPPALYASALLQQGEAHWSRGDFETADDFYTAALAVEGGAARGRALEDAAAARALNARGVLAGLRGENESARSLFTGAASVADRAPGSDIQARILNNLAVLAELRNEREQAQDLYRRALEASPDGSEEAAALAAVIQQNLDRMRP